MTSVSSPPPQSSAEVARATISSIESGLAFYGRTLTPDIRDAVEQTVLSGYDRAASEGRLEEFNAAAHELSRRVVDGLTADLAHQYVIAPEGRAPAITDAASLGVSICSYLPIWPFCR